jgi:hypothetical protein
MKTAIFIRSYERDYPWLEYCLRSIQKFATGFWEIVICVPEGQDGPLKHLTAEQVVTTHDGQPGYLCQQLNKLQADLHTPGADYVLHFDSDMMFTAPVTPEFFFKDGKPVWVVTPWSVLTGDEKKAWMHVLVKALQEFPPYEFMRKCATMVPRWLYAEFRAHMEKLHGVTIEQYVMNQPAHEFSEYNCLGFYAWLYHRDKFHWHDTTIDGVPKWPFRQRWSWSGLTQQERNEMEIALA